MNFDPHPFTPNVTEWHNHNQPHYNFGLANTFGALYFGVMVAAILFGLTCLQTFIYFKTHQLREYRMHKLIFSWLWFLDAFHLALNIYAIHYYLVMNFGFKLDIIVWAFRLQMIIAIILVLFVHGLYAYRICIFSKGKNPILPIVVCSVVTAATASSMTLCYSIYRCPTFMAFERFQWSMYLTLSSFAIADFVIAASMCFLLASSRTGFSKTDSTIRVLTVHTIGTGCVTSICSITSIITCAAMNKNMIYMAIELLLIKLYVNSYMAMMNSQYYQGSAEPTFSGLRAKRIADPLNSECRHQINLTAMTKDGVSCDQASADSVSKICHCHGTSD